MRTDRRMDNATRHRDWKWQMTRIGPMARQSKCWVDSINTHLHTSQCCLLSSANPYKMHDCSWCKDLTALVLYILLQYTTITTATQWIEEMKMRSFMCIIVFTAMLHSTPSILLVKCTIVLILHKRTTLQFWLQGKIKPSSKPYKLCNSIMQ